MACKNPDTKVSNTPSAKKERKILLCQLRYIHRWQVCVQDMSLLELLWLACNFKQKKGRHIQLQAINVYCAVLAFTGQPSINGPCGLNIFIQIIGTVPVCVYIYIYVCIIICVLE